MKKYYTPDIYVIKFYTKDIVNASGTISEAGEGADGYEDHGDISDVFKLNS